MRLVFQPDERLHRGQESMLAAGVLKDAPSPKSGTGPPCQLQAPPSGMVLCGRGRSWRAALFLISVRGTGCHGAMPETGVDPINIAAHIYLSC